MIHTAVDILFVFSDLIMLVTLFNLLLPKSFFYNLKINKKILIWLAVHLSYGIFFSFCYESISQGLQVIVFVLYFARFIFIPMIVSRKISFEHFYLPVLILSLDSLMKSVTLWVSSQFIIDVNENIISKTSSFAFQVVLFVAVNYICIRNESSKNKIKFAFNFIPKSVKILILLCIFVMEAVISLITYDTGTLTLYENILFVFLMALMIIIFIIIILFLLNCIARRYSEDIAAVLKKQIDDQITHYEAMNEIKNEYYSFRHDYKNHMNCLYALISSQKNQEALQYISDLSNSAVIAGKSYETGNHILDAIISDKASVAEKLGIKISLSGIFTDKISPIDVCIIFSNLLDNAIEACSKLDNNKKIDIELNISQGYQYISIKNPYAEKSPLGLQTTKKDKRYHGFGIYNIENSVRHYDGNMKIETQNNIFAVQITIKIQKR